MKVKTWFFGPIRRPWPEQHREIDIPDGTDIYGLIKTLGYQIEDMRRVAVVVNGKKRPLRTDLCEGDDVRFVLLAGGG